MEPVLLAADSICAIMVPVIGVLAALNKRRDLKWARFLVYSGATIMTIRWGGWALMTDSNWVIRGLVGALVGGALCALVPATTHWLSERLNFESKSVPVPLPAPKEEPPMGSLVFSDLDVVVYRDTRLKKVSVQLVAKVKNSNQFLLKYHAKLYGEVNGKPGVQIEVDGFVSADQLHELILERVFDVELPGQSGKPTLVGFLYYDVSFWAASDPNGQKRRSARKCNFEMVPPPPPSLPTRPGDTKRTNFPLKIIRTDEVEQ